MRVRVDESVPHGCLFIKDGRDGVMFEDDAVDASAQTLRELRDAIDAALEKQSPGRCQNCYEELDDDEAGQLVCNECQDAKPKGE